MPDDVVVTKGNLMSTAEWCKGTVGASDALPSGRSFLYIQVNAASSWGDRESRAYIGDQIKKIDDMFVIERRIESEEEDWYDSLA